MGCLQPACIYSCLFLPLTVLRDGVISAGRQKRHPPTCWEAASLCLAALTWQVSRGLGPVLSSCVSPHPVIGSRAVGGCPRPSVVAPKGPVLMSAAVAGPHQEGALLRMPVETLPAWGASCTLSAHLGMQLLKPLHPLPTRYSY